MQMEKTFEFTVVLQGTGKDIDEAWEDAIAAFEEDPGTYASANEIP